VVTKSFIEVRFTHGQKRKLLRLDSRTIHTVFSVQKLHNVSAAVSDSSVVSNHDVFESLY